MKRVAITTLGCKTNQFESAAMAEQFSRAGYLIVPFSEEADIYVINSCTVTARTDAETRRLARRARRRNPSAKIVATGCYAQVAPDELERLPEIDSVLGNCEKRDIVGLAASGESRVRDINIMADAEPLRLESFAEHTRAFLQAQNGCDSSCAYCIVPSARGRSRSVPLNDVIEGVRNLVANGYQEIVLTGIHLGAYGTDLTPRLSLCELVRRITGMRLVSRLRIGSVEPNELGDDLISHIAASESICPHLHLPLQSGSDAVLSHMGRGYSAAFFRELIHKVTIAIPEAFIGTDVIAGFPGETDAEFGETCDLAAELPLSDLHVFPYSLRPGTRAATMTGQVAARTVTARAADLRSIAQAAHEAFLEKFCGKNMRVLVQSCNDKDGICRGLTRNYITVSFPGYPVLINSEVMVRILSRSGTTVYGKLM